MWWSGEWEVWWNGEWMAEQVDGCHSSWVSLGNLEGLLRRKEDERNLETNKAASREANRQTSTEAGLRPGRKWTQLTSSRTAVSPRLCTKERRTL